MKAFRHIGYALLLGAMASSIARGDLFDDAVTRAKQWEDVAISDADAKQKDVTERNQRSLVGAKEALIKVLQAAIKAGHTEYAEQTADEQDQLKLLSGDSVAKQIEAKQDWQEVATLQKGFYRITASGLWQVVGQQTDADGLDRGDPQNNIKHLGALVAKLNSGSAFHVGTEGLIIEVKFGPERLSFRMDRASDDASGHLDVGIESATFRKK